MAILNLQCEAQSHGFVVDDPDTAPALPGALRLGPFGRFRSVISDASKKSRRGVPLIRISALEAFRVFGLGADWGLPEMRGFRHGLGR